MTREVTMQIINEDCKIIAGMRCRRIKRKKERKRRGGGGDKTLNMYENSAGESNVATHQLAFPSFGSNIWVNVLYLVFGWILVKFFCDSCGESSFWCGISIMVCTHYRFPSCGGGRECGGLHARKLERSLALQWRNWGSSDGCQCGDCKLWFQTR